MIIDVARDFSAYPSGRVPDDSTHNGQDFRRNVLLPAIKSILESAADNKRLIIDIDGVRVFGSSFLEEAFGGLVREASKEARSIIERIEVRRTKPGLKMYEDDIKGHLAAALSEKHSN